MSAGVPTRVLVVEDEEDLRLIARITLEGAGCAVTEVMSGEAAVPAALEASPDVIVLDVVMREVSGWDVLAALKGDPRLAGIPVVLCTTAAATKDILRGRAMGAAAHVTKPYHPDELVTVVRRVICDSVDR